ncbi:peptidase domain-containing ABC transporter [Emticicia sp. 17c]|uniref:peptidase domain-containing ABC transporter n=1 Tax=Emticicia sp. 17c TaxID=3127704 RepID=UPI00301D5A18
MLGNKYKFFSQLDFMDCGPTCLRMISSYFGKDYTIDFLRANAYISRSGASMVNLSLAAEKVGFRTLMVKINYDKLTQEAPLPCILHWNQEHYVVLYDYVRKFSWSRLKFEERLIVADPGHGLVSLDKEVFLKCWTADNPQQTGVALLMEPSPEFYQIDAEEKEKKTNGFKFLLQYLMPYKKYLFQIFLGMLFGSLVSLIFPFLTQSLVDYGIHQHNLGLIHLILIAQLLLFLGGVGVDVIRNWILLHINTRISVSIISNFLIKLMKLPISFFESKNVGDITQRINDHHRIEEFLTGHTINTLFSILNIIIFSAVLGVYSGKLLLVFVIGSILSLSWVFLFLKQRKNLDYKRFQRMRENQSSIFELITGMQEIKLNNCERARRWEWERIQAKLFKVNIKGLSLEQYQEVGSTFFTQSKNIIVTYIAATQVINNEISLGVMLSISYIIGQLNGPLGQIIEFIKSVQDSKMSLDRLSEIHNKSDEELNEEFIMNKRGSIESYSEANLDDASSSLRYNNLLLDTEKGIQINNLSFRYGGPHSPLVLKNLNLYIPKGKITAIVGSSGSGKTTLLKLLLKFYPPQEGEIKIDGIDMSDLSASNWRGVCGTVMQDGYIFSDTIVKNIAVDGQKVNEKRLMDAVHTANIQDYIKKLPLGFSTKIGSSGAGLSGGQRQRIFIARAVYKNPQYIFFDEATSALDANNETVIMENLERFFKGRTVVIIAHRLSTVKNADQIIVMDNGEIKEIGSHKQLSKQKGYYYQLVKNQLELDAA